MDSIENSWDCVVGEGLWLIGIGEGIVMLGSEGGRSPIQKKCLALSLFAIVSSSGAGGSADPVSLTSS